MGGIGNQISRTHLSYLQNNHWKSELLSQIRKGFPMEILEMIYQHKIPVILQGIEPCLPHVEQIIPMQDIAGSLTFSPDGEMLAVGTAAGVTIYDTRAWGIVHNIRSGKVLCLSFNKSGTLLATGHDERLKVYRTDTWKEHHDIPITAKEVSDIAFYDEDKLLAVSYLKQPLDEGGVIVLSTASWQVQKDLNANSQVFSLSITPSGGALAAALRNGNIMIWDTTHWRNQVIPLDSAVSSVAYHPTENLLSAGTMSGKIRVFPIEQGFISGTAKELNTPRPIWSISYNPLGNTLAAGVMGSPYPDTVGQVNVWNLTSGLPTQTLKGTDLIIGGIQYNPTGDSLAATNVGRLYIWKDWSVKLRRYSTLMWILSNSNSPIHLEEVMQELEKEFVWLYSTDLGEKEAIAWIQRYTDSLRSSIVSLSDEIAYVMEHCFSAN